MKSTLDMKTIERSVLLALCVLIIGALVYLLVTGAHVNRSLAGPLRLLLAIAGGVFGAALPGAALKVAYDRNGLAVRAAGAAAFFLLVWLGGPMIGAPQPPPAPTLLSEARP